VAFENEIKFILDEKRKDLFEDALKVFGSPEMVNQGYLDGNLIISKQTVSDAEFSFSRDGWTFTKEIDNKFCMLLTQKIFEIDHIHPPCTLISKENARVRSIKALDEIAYYITYKKQIKGQIVEIEGSISETIFERWWDLSKKRISKYRFKHIDEHQILWDLDFLLDDEGGTYFVMAEAEMEWDMEHPPVIHPFVSANLIYQVERLDKRFTNKRLSDVNYARNLLNDIRDGTLVNS